jgi:sulfur-carrier protein
MKVLYFAWVRERAGTAQETVTPPENVRTVRDLARWLSSRSEGHAAAFASLEKLRVAINQDQARLDDAVKADDEIAFFPPMTGG